MQTSPLHPTYETQTKWKIPPNKQTLKIQLTTTTHTPDKILKNDFPVMKLSKSWSTASWKLVHARWADCSVFSKGVLPILLCKSTPILFTCTHCAWRWAAHARVCMWILDRKQNWSGNEFATILLLIAHVATAVSDNNSPVACTQSAWKPMGACTRYLS